MSHDSSEPKSIIEEMNLYEFEADYGDDFDDDEDDVYTDDGELRKIYDTDQNSTDAEKDDADINTPLDKQDAEDK
jgi:hypothetical protein